MTSSTFTFGPWKCPWTEAFYLSELSIAIVNTKPIVPGHCLVISRRVAHRVRDLSPEEQADLWKVASKVGGILEKEYGAEALTFTVQDGTSAGQTVPHVHFHLLPRKKGDFSKNDMVYDELEKWERIDARDDRKPRTAEEMKAEASKLRTLFEDSLEIPKS